VKVTSHKNIAGVGLCTPVSAGFFTVGNCKISNKVVGATMSEFFRATLC